MWVEFYSDFSLEVVDKTILMSDFGFDIEDKKLNYSPY